MEQAAELTAALQGADADPPPFLVITREESLWWALLPTPRQDEVEEFLQSLVQRLIVDSGARRWHS